MNDKQLLTSANKTNSDSDNNHHASKKKYDGKFTQSKHNPNHPKSTKPKVKKQTCSPKVHRKPHPKEIEAELSNHDGEGGHIRIRINGKTILGNILDTKYPTFLNIYPFGEINNFESLMVYLTHVPAVPEVLGMLGRDAIIHMAKLKREKKVKARSLSPEEFVREISGLYRWYLYQLSCKSRQFKTLLTGSKQPFRIYYTNAKGEFVEVPETHYKLTAINDLRTQLKRNSRYEDKPPMLGKEFMETYVKPIKNKSV